VNTPTGELRGALLDSEDFGEGWTEQTITDVTVADQYYCGVKVELPQSDATVILSHAETQRAVFEGILQRADAASAAGLLDTVRNVQRDCDDYISTDGERRTDWHTESFRDVDIGDEGIIEIASTDSFGASPATSYSVTLRKGATLIIVVIIAADADESFERAVTDIAALALAEYERVN
jgi:hypothetical protein